MSTKAPADFFAEMKSPFSHLLFSMNKITTPDTHTSHPLHPLWGDENDYSPPVLPSPFMEFTIVFPQHSHTTTFVRVPLRQTPASNTDPAEGFSSRQCLALCNLWS